MDLLPAEATDDDCEERATLIDDKATESDDGKGQPTCEARGSDDVVGERGSVGEAERRENDGMRRRRSIGNQIGEEGGSESGDEGKGSAGVDER